MSTDAMLRSFAFLAKAGEVLAESLDYAETLQEVARLAVPVLGDMCIVDVLEHGRLRRVATAHVSPAKAGLLDTLARQYPASPDSPQPAALVVRTGTFELISHLTPDIIRSRAIDEEHARLILALGVQSHLAVPLVARGTTVGVISLGISESGRRYGPQDVELASDLARRAALAVDNARLYALAQAELTERRRTAEALRLSEERSRAILDQSPLSMQILAPSGETLRVNRAWEDLWGMTLHGLADYNILTDPQLDVRGIAPLLRRAFAGEPVHLPAIRYDPNETLPGSTTRPDPVRWVRAFAYPVRNDQGAVREVVLVHEDVTDARLAQEQLGASEERLRLALAAGHMNVWDWDLSTNVVECSENAREFWGIDVGQASDFMAVVHPDDLPAMEDATRRAIESDGDYLGDYRIVVPERPVRWVQSRGRVTRTSDGRAVQMLGVTVDITGLKRAEETTKLLADAGGTLGASLDYHATLQELTHLLVPRLADWCAVDLLTDSDSLERVSVNHPDPERVALANELFVKYPPRRTDGHGAWHVIDTGQPDWASDISDEVLEAVAHGPEHLALIRQLQLRSFICVPLVARGTTIGVLTLAQAESGRRYKAADVELAMDLARRAATAVDNARLYQQMRAEDRRKDEFLATLAHELRNPLAPIRTGLTLLRTAKDPAAAERTRAMMDRQLGHMVRLIDDLLDLSRVTRGTVELDVERVDLWSVVGTAMEACRPLIDAAGVDLLVRLPETPVLIDADRTRMAQVISNLLNNAAKFSERGDRVDLEVTERAAEVVVRVRDTGVGIPKEMLSHIFEMFTQVGDKRTTQHGGLGIGLTLVRRLVELHGGRVWAESQGLGFGSVFVVALPRARVEPAATQATAAPQQERLSASARRVLVVDDNVDAAEMLAALLALDGHDIRTAASGPEALEVVRTFHPDVALLDIGMPGMSGYELARRLRAEPRLAGMMLVAVTGWGQDEDRRQSREAGLDHHLTKPVDPGEVQALVGSALASVPAGQTQVP